VPVNNTDIADRLWNQHTTYCALPTRNVRFPRKLMTAHHLLPQFQFGNLFLTMENVEYKEYKGMNFFKTREDIPFDKHK